MKIKIKEKYLIFREQARSLANFVLKKSDHFQKKISLDFSNVNFVSRSFADEFLNFLEKAKKKVHLINMNSSVSKMFKLTKAQKEKIKNLIAN